jgi:hypothetical protein
MISGESGRRDFSYYFICRQSVRAKAVEIVQQVYMRFRDLYDEKMVEKVIIPIFADIDKEKDALIQVCAF